MVMLVWARAEGCPYAAVVARWRRSWVMARLARLRAASGVIPWVWAAWS